MVTVSVQLSNTILPLTKETFQCGTRSSGATYNQPPWSDSSIGLLPSLYFLYEKEASVFSCVRKIFAVDLSQTLPACRVFIHYTSHSCIVLFLQLPVCSSAYISLFALTISLFGKHAVTSHLLILLLFWSCNFLVSQILALIP